MGLNSYSSLWVDIVVIIILARGASVGVKSDIISELIKFVGNLCALCIALQYYSSLGKSIKALLTWKLQQSELLAFFLLFLLITLMFYLVQEGWLIILRVQTQAVWNKWGGLVIALIRHAFLCSVILLAIIISGQKNILKSVKESMGVRLVGYSSINLYRFFYAQVISRVIVDEKMNEQALKLFSEQSKFFNNSPSE